MKAKAIPDEMDDLFDATSSELAVDHAVVFQGSGAFVWGEGEMREIPLDEIKAGAYLLPPNLMSAARGRVQKLLKRKFRSKVSSVYSVDSSLIVAAASLFSFLMSASIQESAGLTESIVWNIFNGTLITLFFGNVLYGFFGTLFSMSRPPEKKFISCGILEVPEFRDSSGNAYEVGNPTHEQLYDAVLKFGELHALVRQREKLETSIEKLKMRVKSDRVQKKLDDEISQLSSLDEQVRGIEEDIQTLLRGQNIDESTSTQ